MNEIQNFISDCIEDAIHPYENSYGKQCMTIQGARDAIITKIKSDLLAIADKGELEELRREVENYF